MKCLTSFLLYILVLVTALGGLAFAQDTYPNKPIKLVLSFDAGGVSDVLGRALAAKIGPSIGQTIFVENRPGAGSTVAAAFVANSPPDGYTVWLQDLTAHAINASLYKRLSFDPVKAFDTVTLVGYSPLMLVVPPQSPAKSVSDLVTMIKSNPSKFNYASAGSGTGNHLSAEIFKKAIGANAGTLKGLAVTANQRSSGAPEISTMKEAGIQNAELVIYSGILVPAGTPRSIIDKLNKEFIKAVESDDIKALFIRNGVEPITNTPEALKVQIQNDIAHFAPIVKASGATID